MVSPCGHGMSDNLGSANPVRQAAGEIAAIIAGDTGAGNSQSMLCARERTSAMQGARECMKSLQA